MLCSKCGSLNDDYAKFCNNCGAQLLGIDDAPPVSGEPILSSEPAANVGNYRDIKLKQKKPIYKRVWFWILAVFLILYFVGLTSDDSRSDYILSAKTAVKQALKSPSTAEFCNYNDISVFTSDNNLVLVMGYVDAQNGFGAMIRSDFLVELAIGEAGSIKCMYIALGDKTYGNYIEGDFKLLK